MTSCKKIHTYQRVKLQNVRLKKMHIIRLFVIMPQYFLQEIVATPERGIRVKCFLHGTIHIFYGFTNVGGYRYHIDDGYPCNKHTKTITNRPKSCTTFLATKLKQKHHNVPSMVQQRFDHSRTPNQAKA